MTGYIPPKTAHLSTAKHQKLDVSHFAIDIIQNLPIAVYTIDADGFITAYNKAAATLWGREPEINKELWTGAWKIYEPSGEPLLPANCPIAKAIRDKRTIEEEEIIIERPDGTRKNVVSHPVPVFDAEGTLSGAMNTLIDVTEQRSSQENKAMLAAIVASSHDAIISKNLKGIIKTWNKEAERMFGYTAPEAVGRHISLIIPIERLSEENHIISKIVKGERIDHFETVRVTKSGRKINISLTISPIKDDKGTIIGASKIARDITMQKEMEEKMRSHVKSLQIINSLAKSVSENLDTQAILQKVTDATTQLIDAEFGAFFYNAVNEKGDCLLLYTVAGISSEMFEQSGMLHDTHFFATVFSNAGVIRYDNLQLDTVHETSVQDNKAPLNTLQVKSYMAVPVFSKMGDIVGGLLYGHSQPARFTKEHEDIVTGIASQAALALENARLFEKIEALNVKKDEFIGLASHELKTPVTSVSGYLQILERTLDDNGGKTFIKKAVHQINKLSSLISDLLDVSKINTGKMPFNFTSFDLIQLLNEVKEMMQPTNPSHTIDLACGTGELMVVADRQRIEQVIINLISNAIKYSPQAHMIHIRCCTDNGKAAVSVKDYGSGIPEEEQKLIFERFYRVKNVAAHVSGLGIGLYISNEIINRHQGKLSLLSKVGVGSTFTFEIPFEQ